MGRGRAKAKQTKVARQLKYNSGGTDLSRLAEELGASPSNQSPQPSSNGDPGAQVEDDELNNDPYAQYAKMYNDDDEDDEDEPPSGSGSPSRRRGA